MLKVLIKRCVWGVVFTLAFYEPVSAFKKMPKIIGGISHRASDPSHNICMTHIASIEKQEAIPDQLLTAIAHVESGRWNKAKKKIEPWPWAVHAEGKGYFFSTKAEAVQFVKSFLERGITNIDIGCMQINIGHHGEAFGSLSQMFDPAYNVAYAAKFLKSLKRARASWSDAVAHYHSATPLHHIPYRKKVYEAWIKARDENGLEVWPETRSTHIREIRSLEQRDSSHYGLVGARRLIIVPKKGGQPLSMQQISYKQSTARPMVLRAERNMSGKRRQLPRHISRSVHTFSKTG